MRIKNLFAGFVCSVLLIGCQGQEVEEPIQEEVIVEEEVQEQEEVIEEEPQEEVIIEEEPIVEEQQELYGLGTNTDRSEEVQGVIDYIFGPEATEVEVCLETIEMGSPYFYTVRVSSELGDLMGYYELENELQKLDLHNNVIIQLSNGQLEYDVQFGVVEETSYGTEEYYFEDEYVEEPVYEEPVYEEPQVQQPQNMPNCYVLAVGEPYNKMTTELTYRTLYVPDWVKESFEWTLLIFTDGHSLLVENVTVGQFVHNPTDIDLGVRGVKLY